MNSKLPFAALALLALAGCAGTGGPRDKGPAETAIVPPPPPTPGAIYRSGRELSLFADTRARQVGDILTVVLVEKTQAKKSATTTAAKDNTANIAVPSIVGYNLTRGQASIDAARKFSGGGDSSQSNQLDGNITVTVVEVLANGNLRIAGDKRVRINQGDETVRLTGLVRPADIATDNTVLSSRVANAQIAYSGSGTLADSNAPGWLSRILNSAWWPF